MLQGSREGSEYFGRRICEFQAPKLIARLKFSCGVREMDHSLKVISAMTGGNVVVIGAGSEASHMVTLLE